MRWMIVVAVVSAIACSNKKSDSGTQADPGGTGQPSAPSGKGEMKTYSIAADGGAAPVKIQVSIPSSWKETAEPEAPKFEIPGATVRRLTFAALSSLQGDPAEQMAKAIKMQFGDAAESAERAELSGGRVWVSGKLGTNAHARMFVPHAGGIVMGVALLAPDSAGKLPEIKSAFETITVVP